MRMRAAVLITAVILALAPTLDAQDLLSRLFSPKPVLTTGLSNTLRSLPLLDDDEEENAGRFGDLRTLARDADGAFALQPGAWQTKVESFCLYAGTTGPSSGDGYLLAPLAGPKSAIITSILSNAWKYPVIPQHDIQSLLWAILSHARFSQLSPELKAAAAQLVSARDIAVLEADAEERITSAVLDQAMSRLPAAAAKLFEAEARLRDALATGASYEEQARLAVLDGDPEPQAGDRDVPAGRWNFAGGYLIRFLPETYQQTVVQVMRPERVDVSTDAKGRIVALRSPDGWATEAEYDDAIAPLVIPGERDFKGYAFKRLTVKHPANGRIETYSVANTGWTFAGHFTGNGRVDDVPTASVGDAWFGGPSIDARMQDRDINQRFSDWQKAYKDAKRGYDRSKPPSSKDADKITDPKHYGKGVKAALGADPGAKAKWLEDHFNRLGRAAAYIACRLEGGCDPDQPPGKWAPGSHAAVPGANGSQRLGLSGR